MCCCCWFLYEQKSRDSVELEHLKTGVGWRVGVSHLYATNPPPTTLPHSRRPEHLQTGVGGCRLSETVNSLVVGEATQFVVD